MTSPVSLCSASFYRRISAVALLGFVLSFCGCGSENAPVDQPDSLSSGSPQYGPGGCLLLSGRNTLKIGTTEVEIWVPEGNSRGNVLVLPGWNFTRMMWCDSSLFCRKALHEGYCLILPEMGKSVYASRHYPETRPDWRSFPTSNWVTDTMIPFLQQKHCLLQKGGDNFLLGLSTGGRGVAILAMKAPHLFKAGAALSGDFDQTLMRGDNLMKGFYGTYDDFKDRWEGEDNPALHADRISIPLYLAHGKKDTWVPWQQTEHFYKRLLAAHPQNPPVMVLQTESGHDWTFWDSEVDNVLQFFERASHPGAEGI